MDRIPGFEPVGCRFESCRLHQLSRVSSYHGVQEISSDIIDGKPRRTSYIESFNSLLVKGASNQSLRLLEGCFRCQVLGRLPKPAICIDVV